MNVIQCQVAGCSEQVVVSPTTHHGEMVKVDCSHHHENAIMIDEAGAVVAAARHLTLPDDMQRLRELGIGLGIGPSSDLGPVTDAILRRGEHLIAGDHDAVMNVLAGLVNDTDSWVGLSTGSSVSSSAHADLVRLAKAKHPPTPPTSVTDAVLAVAGGAIGP